MKRISLIALAVFSLSFAFVVKNWKPITEDTQVKFTVFNRGQDVHGTFSGMNADIRFSANALDQAYFKATIPVSTVNTGIESRDQHILRDDFFDATKYPEIRFQSKSFEKTEKGYRVHGDLTIKNVTKTIAVDFTLEPHEGTAVFKAALVVDRYDYGVGQKGDGSGNIINLNLTIPVKP